jgi:outer membrane protein TolC
VDIVVGDKLLAVLRQTQAVLDARWQRVQQSVQAGQGEMTSGAPYFAAAADAHTALNDLERLQLSRRHDLAALMGLAPDASIALDENLSMPPIKTDDVHALTDDIARRRPDLIALRLGYEAQDAQLRAQIRAQFPAFALGYATASDNSRVYNGGPAITLELPLFDRNQANIKIASATRQQLHDDYENRLRIAHNDIAALLAENAQARAQQAQLQAQLPQADHLAANAQAALDAGNIDLRSYVDLTVSARSRHAAFITLEQIQMEQQIALATLVGAGLPSVLPKEVTSP